MRQSVRKQLPLVEPAIEHEHAGELHRIRRFVDEHPEIADLVHADLVRGLKNPHTGRRGRLSAEQVLIALFIKQMNDFSYEVLARISHQLSAASADGHASQGRTPSPFLDSLFKDACGRLSPCGLDPHAPPRSRYETW